MAGLRQEHQHHRAETVSRIFVLLQDILNIEQLAQRYENVIYKESKLHDSSLVHHDEYLRRKIRDLLRRDSPNDILSCLMSSSDEAPALSDGEDSKIPATTDAVAKPAQPNLVPQSRSSISTSSVHSTSSADTIDRSARPMKLTKRPYELPTLYSPLYKRRRISNSNDDQIRQWNIFQMTRRLIELHHASRCSHSSSNDDGSGQQQRRYNNHNASCPESNHCADMKRLWKHLENCRNDSCQRPHCRSSRSVLGHYQYCQSVRCPVCTEFQCHVRFQHRQSQTRHVGSKVDDAKPSSSGIFSKASFLSNHHVTMPCLEEDNDISSHPSSQIEENPNAIQLCQLTDQAVSR